MSTSCYQATYPPPPADSVTAQFADFSSAPDRHDLPLVVRPEFITDEEHDMLVKLFHKKLRRHRYEYDHWDGVIHGFRELMIPIEQLPKEAAGVMRRVIDTFFHDPSKAMKEVHVLDLADDGYIERHVDSLKFSGHYVIGLCLCSDAVMRLYEEAEPAQPETESSPAHDAVYTSNVVSLFAPRKAVYVLGGEARYHWAHEIPGGEQNPVVSAGEHTAERSRRISIIFRDEKEADAEAATDSAGASPYS